MPTWLWDNYLQQYLYHDSNKETLGSICNSSDVRSILLFLMELTL